MNMDVEARPLSDDDLPEWDMAISRSDTASGYFNSVYLRALSKAAGATVEFIGFYRDHSLVGGLPLFVTRSAFGLSVTPRPLLYYNGLWIDNFSDLGAAKSERKLISVITCLDHFLSRRRYSRVKLKLSPAFVDARPFMVNRWLVRPTYTYVVPLTEVDELWSRFDRDVRRLARKAESEGIFVTENSDTERLFELHAGVHERKGAPLYLDQKNFNSFVDEIVAAGLASVFHARLPGGRIIASQLVLQGAHPVSHTICAASDPEFDRLGSNSLLRWQVFQKLSHRGATGIDLTDAAINPVSAFKAKLGAELRLTLVVSRPDSVPLRFADTIRRTYYGVRATAGSSLRKLRSR